MHGSRLLRPLVALCSLALAPLAWAQNASLGPVLPLSPTAPRRPVSVVSGDVARSGARFLLAWTDDPAVGVTGTGPQRGSGNGVWAAWLEADGGVGPPLALCKSPSGGAYTEVRAATDGTNGLVVWRERRGSGGSAVETTFRAAAVLQDGAVQAGCAVSWFTSDAGMVTRHHLAHSGSGYRLLYEATAGGALLRVLPDGGPMVTDFFSLPDAGTTLSAGFGTTLASWSFLMGSLVQRRVQTDTRSGGLGTGDVPAAVLVVDSASVPGQLLTLGTPTQLSTRRLNAAGGPAGLQPGFENTYDFGSSSSARGRRLLATSLGGDVFAVTDAIGASPGLVSSLTPSAMDGEFAQSARSFFLGGVEALGLASNASEATAVVFSRGIDGGQAVLLTTQPDAGGALVTLGPVTTGTSRVRRVDVRWVPGAGKWLATWERGREGSSEVVVEAAAVNAFGSVEPLAVSVSGDLSEWLGLVGDPLGGLFGHTRVEALSWLAPASLSGGPPASLAVADAGLGTSAEYSRAARGEDVVVRWTQHEGLVDDWLEVNGTQQNYSGRLGRSAAVAGAWVVLPSVASSQLHLVRVDDSSAGMWTPLQLATVNNTAGRAFAAARGSDVAVAWQENSGVEVWLGTVAATGVTRTARPTIPLAVGLSPPADPVVAPFGGDWLVVTTQPAGAGTPGVALVAFVVAADGGVSMPLELDALTDQAPRAPHVAAGPANGSVAVAWLRTSPAGSEAVMRVVLPVAAGDAGVLDGGVEELDAGTAFDAGTEADAGLVADAGPADDAGQAQDAGTSVDAGTEADGGSVLDAGALDGGEEPVDTSMVQFTSCGCRTDAALLFAALVLFARRRRR